VFIHALHTVRELFGSGLESALFSHLALPQARVPGVKKVQIQDLTPIARILALTVVLVMVQGLGSRLLPAPEAAAQPSTQPSGSFLAIVLAVSCCRRSPSPIQSFVRAGTAGGSSGRSLFCTSGP